MLRKVLLGLALGCGAMTGLSHLVPCERAPVHRLTERFAPHLAARSRTFDDALANIPIRGSDRDIALAADEFVRQRFFHGYSRLRFCDDWAASLSSLAWSDLSAPVRAKDILAYRRAACSQQAIVLQRLLRARGLDVASVRMDGHFLAAVKIDGEWLVMDPNRETRARMFPLSALQTDGPMYRWLYPGWAPPAGTARLTDINGNPALQASIFQAATSFISHFGWMVLGLLYLLLTQRKRRLAAQASPAPRLRAA